MEEIFKKVNLLYIINNDSILLRKLQHQGYEVIDVFSFKDDGDVELGIKNKLTELFGKTFPYRYFGNIDNTIKKEGAIVRVAIKAYKVLLNEKPKVLDNYVDDVVKSGADTFWLHKDEIENETRLREGDKKMLRRVFDNRDINIKIVEDQGDRWIDAKTTLFEDN